MDPKIDVWLDATWIHWVHPPRGGELQSSIFTMPFYHWTASSSILLNSGKCRQRVLEYAPERRFDYIGVFLRISSFFCSAPKTYFSGTCLTKHSICNFPHDMSDQLLWTDRRRHRDDAHAAVLLLNDATLLVRCLRSMQLAPPCHHATCLHDALESSGLVWKT